MSIDPSPTPTAEPLAVLEYPPAPAYQPPSPAYAPAEPAFVAPPVRKARPGWIVPVAIAAVGLIASGALGYLFYTTSNKLDATRTQLAVRTLDLDAKQKQLAAEQAQTAYVKLYQQDLGRESNDFGVLLNCANSTSCRSAAQSMINDTQAFQRDRQSAKVPAAFANVDAALGDGLTAEISALQALLTAISGGNADTIQSAFSDVNDATISVFKTEAQLGQIIN